MKKLILCLIFLFPLNVFAESTVFKGKVVGVTDGDTLSVFDGQTEKKVRLLGIDCPEKKQAFGQAAKQYASDLAYGQEVTVNISGHDRYERSLGTVSLPSGKVLNDELLKAGMCWNYVQYSKSVAYQRMEAKAREKKIGLWAESNPTPPWLFRKDKGR